jgi:hypothetical protein
MCDRTVSDINYPDKLSAAGMPVTVGNLLDMATGEMFPWYKAHFLPSPVMPSQKFKLQPLKVGVDGYIEGFRVEAAVAGCAAPQNVILSNNVKAAALFNLRLVQYLCRINGMPMEEYSRFELRHVRLVDVELTYLFKLETAKSVQAALDLLKARATALYGKKAKFYGSGGSYTLRIETPGGIIKVYIKDLEAQPKALRVTNATVRGEIEDLAPLLLRIEVVLRAADLEKMNLSSPEDWHLTEFNDPVIDTYRKVFNEVIRKRLQLDVWYVTETPSEEVMASLADTHRTLLEFHLQGNNARDHELCRYSGSGKLDPNYYQIRTAILAKVGIDLDIPWEQQVAGMADNLSTLLQYEQRFRVPEHLRAYAFTSTLFNPMMAALESVLFPEEEA